MESTLCQYIFHRVHWLLFFHVIPLAIVESLKIFSVNSNS